MDSLSIISWKVNPVSILGRNGSDRCVPTLVGLRCLRYYLHSGASLDHLESTTTQHPSPWSSLSFMELYDFQRIGVGLGARCYSPCRCGQHYPSQTLSLGRARSVGSCASRLRSCDKLCYNELLHYSLLRVWTSRQRVSFSSRGTRRCLGIPDWILYFPGSSAGFDRGPDIQLQTWKRSGHNWEGEDSGLQRTYVSLVLEMWGKPSVPVKVLSQLWPSESRTSPIGIVSDLQAGRDVKGFLRIARTMITFTVLTISSIVTRNPQ